MKKEHLSGLDVMGYFKRMEGFVDMDKPQRDLQIELEVVSLLLAINEIIDEKRALYNIEYSYDEKIEEIIHYINEHYTEPISLKEIEQIFFINRYYFSHQFKKITGTTFKDYIIKKRINKAAELLKLAVKPARAAELAGFEDYANFYRAFKKIYGISPSKY